MKVLMVTSEWPSDDLPGAGSFIVQQVDFLRRARVDVEILPFRGSKDPRNYIAARRDVKTALSRERYDIVHGQFGQAGAAIFPTSMPVVMTFHGGGDLHGLPYEGVALRIPGKFLQTVSRAVARRADAVVVQSEDLATYLPRGVSYDVIPCGVDLELFKPVGKQQARAELGLDPGERLILFSGSTGVGFKRHALAQAAVDALPADLRARLLVVTGVKRSTIATYMSACDALLVTSAYEAGPVMVKEALACNLPVVATRVGDVPERIGHLDGCVLCADDRVETITAGIADVLRRTEPFDGRSSVADVEEGKLVARLIDVYERTAK